jgi:hypothetical protein
MPEPKAEPPKESPVLLLFSLFLDKCKNLGAKKKMFLLTIFFCLILGFGVFGGMFLYRSPVLIVTDSSFTEVYGLARLKKMELALSYRLFRRIIPVYVDEYAGADLISLAAEDAFQVPFAVLFPHRYMEGAGFYKENHPDTPVYIYSGRNHSSKAKDGVSVSFVRTDIKTDLYRAGLCAALLAGEGSVLFISNVTVPDENREAFNNGLQAQGYTKDPVWRNANSSFSSFSDLGCAVIVGQAGEFFARSPETPVILFSWSDPNLTPRSVKVIFDDSPYAIAHKGYRLLSSTDTEGEIFVSSVPTVLKERIEKEADSKTLMSLVKKELQNE